MMAPRSELSGMRLRTMTRVIAIGVLASFVLIETARRVGFVFLDGAGAFMTVALALAIVAMSRLVFDRDTWLPFLGECVVPPSVITDTYTPNDATLEYRVTVDAGASRVTYWASESGAGVAANPQDAYNQFKNAGVVKVNKIDGSAVLKLRCPAQYKVHGRPLPRHVHYRAIYDSGIMGSVQTENISCL